MLTQRYLACSSNAKVIMGEDYINVKYRKLTMIIKHHKESATLSFYYQNGILFTDEIKYHILHSFCEDKQLLLLKLCTNYMVQAMNQSVKDYLFKILREHYEEFQCFFI